MKSLSALRPRQQSFPRPVDVTKRSPRHERSENNGKTSRFVKGGDQARPKSTKEHHARGGRVSSTSRTRRVPAFPARGSSPPAVLKARLPEPSRPSRIFCCAFVSSFVLRPHPALFSLFPSLFSSLLPHLPKGTEEEEKEERRRGGERRKGGRQRPRRIQTKNSHPPGGPKRKKTLPQKSER